MSTPDVPLRMELTFELPGTPEQIWNAIATANGISAWFIPTDVEERAGGAVCFHMGESSSPGHITGWEPPYRFAFEEPEWAALTDHADADVTPLATEFLVEARSGGTCVVRVVSSAFGTGADWEQEFFEEMEKGWAPFFEHLRLYLTQFPGQQVTPLTADRQLPGPSDAVRASMRKALGVDGVGGRVDVNGLSGEVQRADDSETLIRLDGGIPGYLALFAYDVADGNAIATVAGYLFSPQAEKYVERSAPDWKDWLSNLPVDDVTTGVVP